MKTILNVYLHHRVSILILGILLPFHLSMAESQSGDYKGITDPFGDPTTYEFSDDEKEDKEFFHLGRYIMLGLDAGLGVFTGGLGRTADPGGYFGMRLIYFFDKQLGLELAAHYANHLDQIVISQAAQAQLDTNLIPLTLGIRYYFDIKDSPKAIALSNPYLVFGGGLYYRQMRPIGNSTLVSSEGIESAPGAMAGGGLEFLIYRKHIYLGLDLRYHLIFFSDEASNLGQNGVDRSGDYFSSAVTLTYNF